MKLSPKPVLLLADYTVLQRVDGTLLACLALIESIEHANKQSVSRCIRSARASLSTMIKKIEPFTCGGYCKQEKLFVQNISRSPSREKIYRKLSK